MVFFIYHRRGASFHVWLAFLLLLNSGRLLLGYVHFNFDTPHGSILPNVRYFGFLLLSCVSFVSLFLQLAWRLFFFLVRYFGAGFLHFLLLVEIWRRWKDIMFKTANSSYFLVVFLVIFPWKIITDERNRCINVQLGDVFHE